MTNKAYSKEDLKKAIKQVTDGKLSVYKASQTYKVPRSTLLNHVSGKTNFSVGRPTLFSQEQEEIVVAFINVLNSYGYPPDKSKFKRIASDFAKRYEIRKNNIPWTPGEDWLLRNRWSEVLGFRLASHMAKKRATSVTEENLDEWYRLLENTIKRLGLEDKPHLIFNADETNFNGQASTKRVFAPKGKRVFKLVSDNEKINYTVQVCMSAAGNYMPLYVLYKGKNLYNTWLNGPPNCHYNVSPNGWMIKETFIDWFNSIFLEQVKKTEGPKILIIDGHKSHITLELSERAQANNVTILCLPPNATHVLQPLDVAVFRTVKQYWRDIISAYNEDSDFKTITKEAFPGLLRELVEKNVFCRRYAVAGFESTGIYPVNKNAVDRSLLVKETSNQDDDSNKESSDDTGDESSDDTSDESSGGSSNESGDETQSTSVDVTDYSQSVSVKSRPLSDKTNITTSSTHVSSQHLMQSKTTKSAAHKHEEAINSIVSNHLSLKSQSNSENKRAESKRKLVSKGGGCLTTEDSIDILRQERNEKRIKIEELERKKTEKEQKLARETFEKAKLQEKKNAERQKKQDEAEKVKKLKEINKANKVCSICNADHKQDQENKSKWIGCFECAAWCCYACLPIQFKRACSQVFKCNLCSLEDADALPDF